MRALTSPFTAPSTALLAARAAAAAERTAGATKAAEDVVHQHKNVYALLDNVRAKTVGNESQDFTTEHVVDLLAKTGNRVNATLAVIVLSSRVPNLAESTAVTFGCKEAVQALGTDTLRSLVDRFLPAIDLVQSATVKRKLSNQTTVHDVDHVKVGVASSRW
mmetsp:Transcript_41744/g.102818  ORF Transcript_41744/g.102818 Transcript_41744/m.102818 type:complete len:162 (+) Transcript_41744:137-622(+)